MIVGHGGRELSCKWGKEEGVGCKVCGVWYGEFGE